MMKHSIDIRVYYEDTDAGGVVYYANYLKFAERGRSEMLRAIGVENSNLQDGSDMMFVVRALNADYLFPARLDDQLRLETEVLKIGGASIDMRQSVYKGDQMIFTMDVVMVCVDLRAKPKKIPLSLKEKLNGE